MTGSVFMETLRRNWRQILWWGLGLGSLGLIIAIIIPNADMLKEFANLIKSMPSSMLQMFGGEDAVSAATPEGFLNWIFFSYALLILASYAVFAGINVTSTEEERKIMDVLLSLPIPRWRLVLEKFLAYVVITIGIVVLTFLGLLVGLKASPAMTIETGRLLESTVNLLPSTLLVLAMTVLLTTLLRNRNAAIALAAGIVIGSYFVDTIGQSASASIVNTLRVFSFYAYYDSTSVIRNGLNAGNILLLTAATILLIAGGMWFFENRDIG